MKKLFSTKYTDNGVSIALLLLRLVAGGLMLHHGYDKLMHFSAYAPHFDDPFHVGGQVSLALSLFAEFICAGLVVAGLLTRLAAVPLVADMSVALFYSHHGQVFGAGERAALYLACFLLILFMGPGKISADRAIGK